MTLKLVCLILTHEEQIFSYEFNFGEVSFCLGEPFSLSLQRRWLIEEGGNFDDHNKASVVSNNNAYTYKVLQNPSERKGVDEQKEQEDGCNSYCGYGDDDENYHDLTHTLFDSDGLDFVGSVIDKVKNCKEEAEKIV